MSELVIKYPKLMLTLVYKYRRTVAALSAAGLVWAYYRLPLAILRLMASAMQDRWHPCAYISRVLTPSERKRYKEYQCIYKLELKALQFALEKWQKLLDGQIGTSIDTDHQALIWLNDMI